MGPIVIFVCHFLYLLPNYYQLNALILMGRTAEERTLRVSFLQCEVFAVAAEVLWSALHPQELTATLCAGASLAHAVLQVVHAAFAFGAPSGAYHYGVALPLQAASRLILIPVTQVGNNDTLRKRISPARYRILAWLVATAMALTSLLIPGVAGLGVAMFLTGCPTAALALLFLVGALTAPQESSGQGQPGATADGAHGCPQLQAAEEPNKHEARRYVSAQSAALFLIFGCLVGTTGEALMDVATTLAIRRNLLAGSQDLAIVNQCAILVSMSLAYLTETRFGGNAARRGGLFISIWAGCQAFRGGALHMLEVGGFGPPLLAAFAFLDKYTGPLGMASLETALLRFIEAAAATAAAGAGTPRVPDTVLWTARMVVAKVERPVCQLILLFTAGVPVQLVAWALTSVTCVAVLLVHHGALPRLLGGAREKAG